jgi:DNA-binding MarR family transcriptional regulator
MLAQTESSSQLFPTQYEPNSWYYRRVQYEDPIQLSELIFRQMKRLRHAQAERLAPLGLTPAQERALRMITRSEEPLRMTDLADHLGIVPRSLTTVIDALEEAGLVRREIDPHNRRAIRLHLTARGRSVRDDMREARRRAAEDLFAPLSNEDRATLGELLSQLDQKSENEHA